MIHTTIHLPNTVQVRDTDLGYFSSVEINEPAQRSDGEHTSSHAKVFVQQSNAAAAREFASALMAAADRHDPARSAETSSQPSDRSRDAILQEVAA